MNDLISIIIPIYNRQNVIEDCINSIKAQTFQNYEILLNWMPFHFLSGQNVYVQVMHFLS